MFVDWHGVVEFVEYADVGDRHQILNILIMKTYYSIL